MIEFLFSLLPLFIISLAQAVGVFFLAPRLGRNRIVWTILTLIPLVNFLFMVYVMFQVIFAILDRLDTLDRQLGQPKAAAQ